jgi:DNA-binding CsgD family transcriptional regulator
MKNKEIQLSNYYLQQRTILLEKLKQNITDLKQANAEKEVVFQSIFKQIENAYSMEEIQSNVFSERFDESNNEKINILRSKYPTITLAESRVGVLLSMNLSTKEIADILGISPRGVESHRLHIRKKMNLKRDENMNQVIAELMI